MNRKSDFNWTKVLNASQQFKPNKSREWYVSRYGILFWLVAIQFIQCSKKSCIPGRKNLNLLGYTIIQRKVPEKNRLKYGERKEDFCFVFLFLFFLKKKKGSLSFNNFPQSMIGVIVTLSSSAQLLAML